MVNMPDSKKSWSLNDELEVLIVHNHCGNNWSAAAELLQGRNNNSIKNRFYSIFRKVVSKVKRMETKFSCQTELLEILYILMLMEQHISNPSPFIMKKGRRGKDFIYNLMKNIYTDNIEKYKAKLGRVLGREVALEKLWEEVAVPVIRAKFCLPEGIKSFIEMSKLVQSAQEAVSTASIQSIILPKINFSAPPRELTREEKEFIATQAFSSKVTTEAGFMERSEEDSDSAPTKSNTQTSRIASSPKEKRKSFFEVVNTSSLADKRPGEERGELQRQGESQSADTSRDCCRKQGLG
eukprot:TRINITY_DN3876_c0_g1_i1.p1 TRINITY_DN3876_c0_g1~~TRINITY_DN3876_c0_g1_i1.p1  ORF type:complete len:295 (+),score=84.64 TRINITY_DN3876_c0_g1_i1:165-1049(+)